MSTMISTRNGYLGWLSCTAVFVLPLILAPVVEANEWQIDVVDTTGCVGQCASLALDESGYPHISYYDTTTQNLKYAFLDGSGWHIEVIEGAGPVLNSTSLALSSDGSAHIGYCRGICLESGPRT